MINKFLAGAALLALSWTASAATFSGSLDPSDPTWAGCGSSVAVACNYDALSFTVTASGAYDFDAFYAGAPANLDGILEIYEGGFDPLAPGAGAIGFNDDGPGGSDTSQILGLSLTAGTSYIAVISSFSDAPTSFGEPNGAWELTITGPGDVTVVPVPAAAWLLASGLLGLVGLRRRK